MKRLSFFHLPLAFALAFSLLGSAAPAAAQSGVSATPFVVNSAGDTHDAVPGNGACLTGGGVCTLRAAIEEVNALGSGYFITFSASFTIQPANNLDALARNNTTIDAGGHTIVISKPAGSTAARGLQIDADNCVLHNLTVSGFTDGIIVNGYTNIIGTDGDGVNDDKEGNFILLSNYSGIVLSGRGNTVAGNRLGVSPTGVAAGNKYGVTVQGSNNIIGTDGDGSGDKDEGNVISANTSYGVLVLDYGDQTIIAGNIIGLDPGGTDIMPNEAGGILVANVTKASADGVRIGTDGNGISDDVERNVISGNGTDANTDFGISLEGGSGHLVAGNIIGLNAAGTDAIANDGMGIKVGSATNGVVIGVEDSSKNPDAMGNIVSGNDNAGIQVSGTKCIVAGNTIGLAGDKLTDRGNRGSGVFVDGSDNIIGTDGDKLLDDSEGNLISGNDLRGVYVGSGSFNTVIAGNTIGLNKNADAVPNELVAGVAIGFGADTVRIGTDGDGISDELERNIISGNLVDGVRVATSTAVTISGNYIGTNPDGNAARPNGQYGINLMDGSDAVIIGVPNGGVAAQGNLISGNTYSGIVAGYGKNHVIAGNYIGTDAKGLSALPNAFFGVNIQNTSGVRVGTDNDGTTDQEERNLISANWGYNVSVIDAQDTVISGNWIGLDSTGAAALPNPGGVDTGIGVQTGSTGTVIGSNSGGKAGMNVISGNSLSGIYLSDQSGTLIQNNIIGLSAPSAKGSAKVPNSTGIKIVSPTKPAAPVGAVVIGTNGDGLNDKSEGNVIAGNNINGILIQAGTAHVIAGNFIGTDWDGSSDLGNNGNGIELTPSAGTMTVIGTNGDNLSDGYESNVISGNGGYGVRIDTNSCSVSGNYIGTDPSGVFALPNNEGGVLVFQSTNNYIGVVSNSSGGEAHEGNLISGNNGVGVYIVGGVQSYVSGNRIGTTANGLAALPNSAAGVYIEGGATAQVIGTNGNGISDDLESNIISGNNGAGIYVNNSTFPIILGNIIGLGGDGQTQVQNLGNGVYLYDTINALIGMNYEDYRNTISGNHLEGILLSGSNPGARIEGNRIGTTLTYTPAGNGGDGIRIAGSLKAEGGKAAPAPNTIVESNNIRYNYGAGVLVDAGAGVGHKIFRNTFGWNGGLAIDLYPLGVTPNDADDADTGPNNLQNFPVIETVTFPSTTTVRITGVLNSQPSTAYTLFFYFMDETDPSGHGEGVSYWPSGSLVTTDGSGLAIIDVTLAWAPTLSGRYFTAIAVAPDGSTSEFGPNLELKKVYLPIISR